MSLKSYIEAHCANWISGSCFLFEKLQWDARGNPVFIEGKCRVMEKKPCSYFQKSVLPSWNCPEKIREAYQRIDATQQDLTPARTCPDCGSEPLLPRQRVCKGCRRKRRLRSYRKNRHMPAPQLRKFNAHKSLSNKG